MTAKETHPGLLAINLQAKFVATRAQARTLRAKAASMRREVKATKLRRDVKPLTDEAKDLEQEAEACKEKVVAHTAVATELLNKRMPPSLPNGES